MNTLTLSLGHLRNQGIAALLHITVLAMGIAGIGTISLVSQHLEQRLQAETRSVDLVVAAPGSPLQIILATLLHIDEPTGNIALADTRWLETHPLVARSIPLAMGDSHAGFRIVGTTHAFVELHAARLQSGQLWQLPNGAVLGAAVANETGLDTGDSFVSVHGISGTGTAPVRHDQHPYRVEGILAPTGTAVDRLILVSVESVWRVHQLDDHWSRAGDAADPTATEGDVTALLISYRSPLAAAQLPPLINSHATLQAASPARESSRLLALLAPITTALSAVALVLIAVAVTGLVSAQFHALLARRRELALLRALGSPRHKLVQLIVSDSLIIGAVAAVLGIGLAVLAVQLIGSAVPALHGAGTDGVALLSLAGSIVAGTLLLSCLAAAGPAWLACRDRPSERLETGGG